MGTESSAHRPDDWRNLQPTYWLLALYVLYSPILRALPCPGTIGHAHSGLPLWPTQSLSAQGSRVFLEDFPHSDS